MSGAETGGRRPGCVGLVWRPARGHWEEGTVRGEEIMTKGPLPSTTVTGK